MKNRNKRISFEKDLFKFIVLSILLSYFYTRSPYITFVLLFSVIFVWRLIKLLLKRKKEHNLRKSGIEDIDRMDGIQFEYYLAALLKSFGFKTQVTKSTGDYGADLVISKDNEKIVVQAKRYSKKVGIKAIQEIYSAVSKYKCTGAWVITNSHFTNPAIELAKSNNVNLIDREKLIKMILEANEGIMPTARQVREEIQPKNNSCPVCNAEMVLRNGKNGKFYGCSNYPVCKGTKKF
uniref:Restriction endonuclease n=1 Tax=Aeromonas sp. Ne-1 TaxID=1675689 RepID=A0A0H4J970_9GAMM|nr:restriction endonuclease [Aeromonas sp. Ne-1]AKO69685.1 hypothetical protein [Aeromonas sp. Ne-1]